MNINFSSKFYLPSYAKKLWQVVTQGLAPVLAFKLRGKRG
jgi:hypothetical protein